MTLKRKVHLLVLVVLVVSFYAIWSNILASMHAYSQLHLQRQAQDAANSLAAVLPNALAENNIALVDTLVDAVFDQGSFALVKLTDPQQRVITQRDMQRRTHRAPDWFLERYALEPVPGVVDISLDRRLIARLQVDGDQDYLYRQLWVGATKIAAMLLLLGLLAWGVVAFALRRLFAPLEALEQQARAICNKEQVAALPLPASRELRQIGQAVNRMSKQLKTLFDEQVAQIEQVRNQAYIDSVSGLGNGRFFNAQLDARLHAPEEPFVGALVRVQVDGLLTYNERFGKASGDALLRQIGKLWQQQLEDIEGLCVARVSGARFAALLPLPDATQAESRVRQALSELLRLNVFSRDDSCLAMHAGMAYCAVGEPAHLLEQQADQALQLCAQQKQDVLVFFDSQAEGGAPVFSLNEWQQRLDEVLTSRAIQFQFQPVVSGVDQSVLYHEALARLDIDGELVNAGLFMPLVERVQKEVEFDQLIVSTLLDDLQRRPVSGRVNLSINLSPHSIRHETFIDWLLAQVSSRADLAHHLIFEVSEVAVRASHGKLKRLANGLKRHGARLTIDHFGTTNSSFGYLSGLPLYSIKVDQSYIRDIQDNLDHQFFVQSLVRIAHSRQLLLTAEMVEDKTQWDLLRSFQLDGGQGYYLGEPGSLDKAA